MLRKYFLHCSLLIILFPAVACALIDRGKCQDYRKAQQNHESQKMQDFHLQQAKIKLQKNDLSHAWGDLAYLLCRVPNHHQALQQMVTLAPQLHKQDELQVFLQTALDMFPEDPVVHMLYGAFLFNEGEDSDAEQHLNLAQSLESK